MSSGRGIQGRPINSRMPEVSTGMRGKGINRMEWIDRKNGRRKIKSQLE